MAEALLRAGADITARDDDYAVRWNIPAAIDVLLNAGADVLAANVSGRTPWDMAQADPALRDTDVYWRMNDARYRMQG